ncbi:lysine decarboxylase DesA [Angustibacter speluncae]
MTGPALGGAHLLTRDTAGAYLDAVTGAARRLAGYVGTVDRPRSDASLEELRAEVHAVDLDAPASGDVLDEVSRLYLDHAVWFHEPRYMAHLNCPVVLPALAAEVLVAAVNSSVDTYDQSTAGTLIERRLVAWTAGRIGFDDRADGVFTSGGTQSNLQALLLARDETLARCRADDTGRHHDRAHDRSHDQARLRVLATDQSHFSVQKAARLLGLADDAVVVVPTDGDRRMDPVALVRTLCALERDDLLPMAVVATAGTTDLGRIDPVAALADVCAPRGVWLHVDAAYGCGLLVSRRRRHLLDGVERADSVTVDFHKSFFQPVSSSALVVRRGTTLRHVTHHADYLNPRGEVLPNQVDKSLQTTRRLDALKLWMTLRSMGPDAIGDLFDAVVDLAADAHDQVVAHPDLEVAARPTLSTVVFAFRPEGVDEATSSRLTGAVRARLFDEGRALVAKTVLGRRAWLKLTLLNPTASSDDVRAVLDAVAAAGHELLAVDAADQERIARELRDLEPVDLRAAEMTEVER